VAYFKQFARVRKAVRTQQVRVPERTAFVAMAAIVYLFCRLLHEHYCCALTVNRFARETI
jgi:hypothetical protein